MVDTVCAAKRFKMLLGRAGHTGNMRNESRNKPCAGRRPVDVKIQRGWQPTTLRDEINNLGASGIEQNEVDANGKRVCSEVLTLWVRFRED